MIFGVLIYSPTHCATRVCITVPLAHTPVSYSRVKYSYIQRRIIRISLESEMAYADELGCFHRTQLN